MIKVAINGFGRIGRMVLRSIYENKFNNKIKVVAINNKASADISAFLLQKDTVHGDFKLKVKNKKDTLFISKDKIALSSKLEPKECPWKKHKIDIVFECSGKFNTKLQASGHIKAGAKKVIVSAPCKNADKTVVFGINHKKITNKDKVISVASCTTNCLAPVVSVINENFGIEKGYMTTVHAYTSDQRLLDNSHKDLRRARSAPNSIVPTSTGAAKSLRMIIPEIANKIDGISLRVPVPNVSLVQFNFLTKNIVTEKKINNSFIKASNTNLKNIMGVEAMPLVSSDFNHDTRSSIIDLSLTKVLGGRYGTVYSWYDNEWGFANRMNDLAIFMKKTLR